MHVGVAVASVDPWHGGSQLHMRVVISSEREENFDSVINNIKAKFNVGAPLPYGARLRHIIKNAKELSFEILMADPYNDKDNRIGRHDDTTYHSTRQKLREVLFVSALADCKDIIR